MDRRAAALLRADSVSDRQSVFERSGYRSRVKKTGQNKRWEPGSDSIRTAQAPSACGRLREHLEIRADYPCCNAGYRRHRPRRRIGRSGHRIVRGRQVHADKGGNPTYKISAKTAWSTGTPISGFRRYHSDCHVCHGPNGEGSSYAPALANSLKTLSYSRLQQCRHQRPQERRCRQRQGDAVVRDQCERDVLSRRYLRVSARPRQRCHSGWPSAQTRRQAGSRQTGGSQLYGDQMTARRNEIGKVVNERRG